MAGDEHRFDFPSLILDHKPRSKKTVTLIDLDVDVYGLDEIRKSKLPICAVVSFGPARAPAPCRSLARLVSRDTALLTSTLTFATRHWLTADSLAWSLSLCEDDGHDGVRHPRRAGPAPGGGRKGEGARRDRRYFGE